MRKKIDSSQNQGRSPLSHVEEEVGQLVDLNTPRLARCFCGLCGEVGQLIPRGTQHRQMIINSFRQQLQHVQGHVFNREDPQLISPIHEGGEIRICARFCKDQSMEGLQYECGRDESNIDYTSVLIASDDESIKGV